MKEEISAHALILKQGKFDEVALVYNLARPPKPEGWGFPGGKGEDEEQVKLTMLREIEEETGLVVKILDTIFNEWKIFGTTNVHRYFFLCQALNNGDPSRRVMGETREWRWFRLTELPIKDPYYRSHFRLLINEIGGPGGKTEYLPNSDTEYLIWTHLSDIERIEKQSKAIKHTS